LLAGVTVSGVLMGIFQSNAGGAWDNAKKSFEKGVLINGEMFYKKSEPHKASVTGDTVGDPFKDTSGPSMNILIKLMSIVSLVIAPYIAEPFTAGHNQNGSFTCVVDGKEMVCNSKAQCDSTMTANRHDISELNGMFEVDATHSSVGFSVKHIISNTSGNIAIDSGYIDFDAANGPKIYVQLDMTSLNTQNAYRDGHLKDKTDFFEVTKYNKASFVSTEVKENTSIGNYAYTAIGELTIKGVSKEVILNFNYEGQSEQEYEGRKYLLIGFRGETTINRKDFNIVGSKVSDDVNIKLEIEAAKTIAD
jgi:polyisoprenoid-binding protein YceI